MAKRPRVAPRSPQSAKGETTPGKRPSDLRLWYDANLKQWVPLLATIFGGAIVYLLGQVEAFRPTIGILGGLAVIVGGVIYGLMKPEDAPVRVGKNRALPAALLVALVILSASLYPFVKTNFPGEPYYHGTLSPRHPRAEFDFGSGSGLLQVVVHGQLKPESGSSASGGYELAISHGGHDESLEGSFKRTYSLRRIRRGRARVASSSEFTYHVNQMPSLGSGRYTMELVGVDDTLKNFLRVQVFHTRYTQRTLFYLLAVLVLLGFVADVVTARVRHRTRLAQAAVTSFGFSTYYVVQETPDAILGTTIAGGIVALVAGMVLGWVFGKLAQSMGAEPKRAAKASAGDDHE